jgi:exodeoxyribonuclease III
MSKIIMQYSLYTWNVNGIRAVSKKGFLEWFNATQPDVLGVQEIKADEEKMGEWWQAVSGCSLHTVNDKDDLFGDTQGSASFDVGNTKVKKTKKSEFENTGIFDNYNIVWHACSIKKGYSGTAIFYRKDKFKDVKVGTGLGVGKFDNEGRITILDSENFVLINGYYPQGGREGRIPFKLEFYNEVLKKVVEYQKEGKKVMLCGDLNTTVADIDLARPKENRKTTGCLPEEREVLEKLKKSDLVDAFRHFYPDKPGEYSYWDQITRARDRNVGWRIDYFLVDTKLLSNLKSCQMHQDIFGSDHCPVSILLTV